MSETGWPGTQVHRREIEPGELWSLTVRPGAEVHCLRGRLWVTQEGWWRDCVLLPGMSCVLPGHGKLVVSAEAAHSIALVREGVSTRVFPEVRFDPGLLERLVREAHAERAQESARLIRKFAGRFLNAMRAFARRVRRQKARGDGRSHSGRQRFPTGRDRLMNRSQSMTPAPQVSPSGEHA